MTSTQEYTQAPYELGHSTKDIVQSFTLANEKYWVKCTLTSLANHVTLEDAGAGAYGL